MAVTRRPEPTPALKRGVRALYRAELALRGRVRRALRRVKVIPAEISTWRRGPVVQRAVNAAPTEVDRYWGLHLVRSEMFASAAESADYLEWRFGEYPRYRELMDLWGAHEGEVVLDYGCGPANDTVGFLLYSGAARVVGMDVSDAALQLARKRIALHRVDDRADLAQVSDARPEIPLADESVDFVHCSGVLHHTTEPDRVLREFHRVLRTGGGGRVMVYNRRSVWFHLYVAYALMVLGDEKGTPIDDVFRRSTDGPECPISIAYDPDDFVSLLGDAGFGASFAGGYLSRHELDVLTRLADDAKADDRLGEEHRSFLARIERGADGLPQVDGLYAGIGGVYRLQRR